MFYPTTNTIAYSDHLFGQSLVLFPLFLIVNNPLMIQNIYIISTFVIAAFGTYLLCFYFTKSFWPALISGILYSFSLYHIDHAGQVSTTSIQYIPFIFLFLFRSLETKKRKDILLFWLFFTVNFLSTLYYGLFMGVIFLLFVLFYFREWKFFTHVLLWGVPFGIALIASSYPYIIFRLENPEVVRSIDESIARSAHLVDYFTMKLNHDRALFPGIVTLFLTVVAIIFSRKNKVVWFFGLTAVITILFSLGPTNHDIPLPYSILYRFVPVFQAIRVPARFGIVSIAALSILAGFGLSILLKKIKNTSLRYFLIGTLLIISLLEIFRTPLTFTQVPTLANAPQVYTWLKDQPDGVVLELPLRHGYNSNPIEQQVSVDYTDITNHDNYIAETYRLYFSIIHGKRMMNGYSSYFPTTYQNMATAMETFPVPYAMEQIEKYNIKYIVVHKKQYGDEWSEIEKQIQQVKELEKLQDFDTEIVYTVKKAAVSTTTN